MRILIGSAGRRVYLVRWFQDALHRAGIDGSVFVTDSSVDSAARAVATASYTVPRYEDPRYPSALLDVVDECRPDLVLSLNDYELDRLASGLGEEIRRRGATVLGLSAPAQTLVADKLAMSRAFQDAGIPTPTTVLASDTAGVGRLCDEADELIVKDRFGSGSSGLRRVSSAQILDHLEACASSDGEPGPDHVDRLDRLDRLVVQPPAPGQEIGIDVVATLDGSALAGVLARRKIEMRGGETNAAVTVDAEPYREIAHHLRQLLQPRGLVDVDLMHAPDGAMSVLDVNPRFGGGYPFCHVAGANVPALYVAALQQAPAPAGWDRYRVGTRSAKYVDVVPFLTEAG